MLKRLLAVLSMSILFLTFVPVVSAGQQGSLCSGSDTVWAFLYENAKGDTSDGNDVLIQCGNANTNLGAVSHTLPGDCSAPPFGKVTWSDCVSSVEIYQPLNYVFCGYDDTNYHNLIVTIHGTSGRYNIPSDKMSSFKQVRLGACPAS